MSAKLSEEQRHALAEQAGEPLRLDDEATNTSYVLIRLDLFQQMKKITDHKSEAIAHSPIDEDKLKEAILARRDESRALNQDWEHADREVWDADNN